MSVWEETSYLAQSRHLTCAACSSLRSTFGQPRPPDHLFGAWRLISPESAMLANVHMRGESCNFLQKVEQHITRANSHEDRETALLHCSNNTQQKDLDVHFPDPEEDESTYTMDGIYQHPIVAPEAEWTKRFAREGTPEPEPRTPNSLLPRRSARLATTPTTFSKYADLHHELKLMIWDCVMEQDARVVYIRNSSSSTFEPIVQTPPPIWPKIDASSKQIANLAYFPMFTVNGPDMRPDDRTRQLVNPSVDVIALEDCDGACRRGNCVRGQYSVEDRLKVRFLAVQVS